ncbi:MAG: DUF58 domain-containing protein [Myxococcota bacterium]|nr:DUF58 domain-containing protein [Myxococcota bacterium]
MISAFRQKLRLLRSTTPIPAAATNTSAPEALTASPHPRALDPKVLAAIARLKLHARHTVDGQLSGIHPSPRLGSSTDFAEYKDYSPGDDPRHIDWKAFARSDRLSIKRFHEERHLDAHILLDVSGSMFFGEGDENKLDYARKLAASLAWLLLRQGDAVGLLTFSKLIHRRLPSSSRSAQLDDLMLAMLDDPTTPPDGTSALVNHLKTLAKPQSRQVESRIADCLKQVGTTLPPRSLLLLVSDMLDELDELEHILAVLASRRFDLVLLHIVHPDELELPYEGLTLFQGLERDGELLVEVEQIRQEYRKAFDTHAQRLARLCQEHAHIYVQALSSRPQHEILLELFRLRRKGPAQ